MPTTIPCLWFDGEAEQAAEHYTAVFPNSRVLDVTRFGPDSAVPEGTVMTVEFTLDGQRWIALNGGPGRQFTEAVSFQIPCADQEEVDHYWNGLTAGGSEAPCGWLTDRFGVSWQVVPTRLLDLLRDPDPERARRATAAMLQMTKFDIAELERAADGAPAATT